MITTEQKSPTIVSTSEILPTPSASAASSAMTSAMTVSKTVSKTVDIDSTTIQQFHNEILRMKQHIANKTPPNCAIPTYVISKEVQQIVCTYGKCHLATDHKIKKTPYEKHEYTKGMSNFIAFISQVMPMCSPQKKIHRRFLVVLWDIYKIPVSSWFDDNGVSKEKALALGKDKYIIHLKENVVSDFKIQFQQIIQKFELYDDT